MLHVTAFLQPGMADWEAGPVMGGLREYLGGTVSVATPDGRPVQSMGGLKVTPDLAFHEADPAAASAFVLIGSDDWPGFNDERFFELLREADRRRVPTGAICAA